ncbi:3-phosphoserine/phosphohydroxythreonine transaminase [Paenalkalicoccus suaedae]|uniref:Phosphoserine aminotransferase n=1 Tax=Paenalkalicoccus suaedae TaxID=2592382 RepID=A0A859FBV6_9BACI|nr:3-phosphoserine/phosphohydroxythreonine transaminase [Paenalkalicoccus suaedae]QKS70749.1 3-phosphoserine/phosphohydroxythreonine transaminase [Paenalkalicoccus suaedae]
MTVYNFNAGPSPIPAEVLQQAKNEMFNIEQSSVAVMELSHRGAVYEKIHYEARDTLREILNVPETFEILFLQGGASVQFAMTAMNFLHPDKTAQFVSTGSWSEKAQKEAGYFGQTSLLASSKEDNYRFIPEVDLHKAPDDTAYVHVTSNNTIFGTQWGELPKKAKHPVFVDMSSDILSKEINWDNIDLAYAGAQKNAGMSGVTLVFIKKELLEQARDVSPSLSYKQHAKANSLYNTPPTAAIYMTGLVAKWIKNLGGVSVMADRAKERADRIYRAIDESNGFYQGHAVETSRSLMNITFRLQTEELDKAFLKEASDRGFLGLNGHRSVGGCRVSNYNAITDDAIDALLTLMSDFQK